MAWSTQINGFVGTPLKIYFLNLIGLNSLENITVQVDAGNRGTIYADRWEYTPIKAECFEIAISMSDTDGNLIYNDKTTISVKAASTSDGASVLVIGDSTIAPGAETQTLLNMASADNYNLTLLGTTGTNLNKYEGRGGWTAGTYVKTEMASSITNPFYNPDVTSFDFDYYMKSQGYTDVDCVCIQLGINDIFGAQNDDILNRYITNHISNMEKIINSIHSYNPNIKIIWNLILPGSTDQSKFEAAYGTRQTADRHKQHTYLANLKIIEKIATMDNVYVAHTNLSLDTTNNMEYGSGGGVHPATPGYEEIGQTLYGVIRAIN